MRAILDCTELFWEDVVSKLEQEYGWDFCYLISGPGREVSIRDKFPGKVVHDIMDAIRGIRPGECAGLQLPALDESLLKDLAVHESIVFSMMDRMDPEGIFTFQERVRLYHFQLKYWLAVLEYYKPDVVIFPYSPHIVYDYIFYILCKKKNVRTIMLVSAIERYFYPVTRFEEEPASLLSLYKELLSKKETLQLKFSPGIEDYWNRLQGHYSVAIPFYTKQYIVRPKKYNIFTFCAKLIRTFFKYIRFIYEPAPPNYIKQRGRRFEDAKMTYLEFVSICKFKADKKKHKLQRCYNKLVEKVSLDKPYVFVALHYQPERSTSPEGSVFVNQLLMIELLSKSLPKRWSLYVKEHIGQFSPRGLGERCRNTDFYYDIVASPNVKLVSTSLSPFDLIDKAQAVATVSGTAGWEAVVRGKPVLVFGYPWYRGCEGVFYTPTEELCRKALTKIEQGYKVDRQNVMIFLYAIEKFCFNGYIEEAYAKISGVTQEENVSTIIRAIQSIYKNNYQNKSDIEIKTLPDKTECAGLK